MRIKVLLSDNRLLNSTKNKPVNELINIGDMVFDPSKNTILFRENKTHLTARESSLLNLLCQPGMDIIPRKMLLQKLWGNDNIFNARSLDVFITKLRRHLQADPNIQLINVRGVGYKLVW